MADDQYLAVRLDGVEFEFQPCWHNDAVAAAERVGQFLARETRQAQDVLPSEFLLEADMAYALSGLGVRQQQVVHTAQLEQALNLRDEPIVWVGNEVICSAGGKAADLVTFHRRAQADHPQEPTSISVFELKNVALSAPDLSQLGTYATWMAHTYLRKDVSRVRQVLIGWSPHETVDEQVLSAARDGAGNSRVIVFTYRLLNGQVLLTRHM